MVLGRAADLFDLVTADGERMAGDGGNTGTLHPERLFLVLPATQQFQPDYHCSSQARNDTKKMSHEPIGQHRNIDLAASERRSPNCRRHWRLRADRTNGYALVRIAIRHGHHYFRHVREVGVPCAGSGSPLPAERLPVTGVA